MAGTVYGLLFLAHTFQAFLFKTRYMIAAMAGTFLESVAYWVRIPSINDPFNIPKYATQYCLIIVSPVLIAATQYIMLEKIIFFSYPQTSPVKHLSVYFILCDIVTFLVQIFGSTILVSDDSKRDLGQAILKAGLWLQVASFAAYLAMAMIFYFRAQKLEQAKPSLNPWRKIFYTLMISGSLVFIRSLFRIVQFSYGFRGPIATNETYLYCFDFGLLVLAMLSFNIVHPGSVLKAKFEKDAEIPLQP
ncbi:hypothetical protein HK100_004916 [Physocladia obscura]|uniref:RTA1 like protein n=1 Tax=Physocladia obscura TaxID=109957 RepID=A0AAD5SSG1_9FUNG|nr:hypothetical protein HK100_004916 [Physocladia obscura]